VREGVYLPKPPKRGMLRERVEENYMTIADIADEQDHADWCDLINAQTASLAPVWDNAEDKVWDDA
jgi:hypothetical protein